VLQYLNRVGDLLFVLARYANHAVGTPDVLWEKKG
jgi:cob(I)alamin adenosyltransferase